MTDGNIARHAGSPLAPFWRDLKAGYDIFEAGQMPPKVSVCQGRYAFEAANSAADGSAPIEAKCPQARPQP
jgi:murein L,D-transpeptidase YafK